LLVLRPEIGHHADPVRRFSQEARAASALNTPTSLPSTTRASSKTDLSWSWSWSKANRCALSSGAAPRQRLDIGIQSATALARAHESGITQRDLKSENIMVRPDGYAKILDFGLTKPKKQ